MGKRWGKTFFNATDEVFLVKHQFVILFIQLLAVLSNESAPFIQIVHKRWNFIKQHPMSVGADHVHLMKVTIALVKK